MSGDAAQLDQLVPQQQRSRATRRRILTATNVLLKSRSFESLSVQEISTLAGCSIGAFYGRFRGKDDLLNPLLDRHNLAIGRWITRALATPSWHELPLKERLVWVVRMNAQALRSRRWLISQLTLYVRQGGVTLTETQKRWRSDFAAQVRNLLMDCAAEVAHPDPSDAFDFALFLISTLCRERVLFGELSERMWIATGEEQLVREVSQAAFAYLTCGPAPCGGRA